MSKRILVVEDHVDNRRIIRDMLAVTDYEITEAETGEEALAAIAKQRPDLILMDIQLPTMDGYTATSRIKADPAPLPRSAVKKRRHGRQGCEPTPTAGEDSPFPTIVARSIAAVHESAFRTK